MQKLLNDKEFILFIIAFLVTQVYLMYWVIVDQKLQNKRTDDMFEMIQNLDKFNDQQHKFNKLQIDFNEMSESNFLITKDFIDETKKILNLQDSNNKVFESRILEAKNAYMIPDVLIIRAVFIYLSKNNVGMKLPESPNEQYELFLNLYRDINPDAVNLKIKTT